MRSGYHGKTASGQSVGVYEQARGLVVDPLGPLDQPRPAAPAAQPRDGAQPGRDDLRRGDPGAGQPRFQTDQAGRRGDLHEGLRGEAGRLERGGVRDPRGRQGARDRRVQLAAAGQGVLPHRRHHGAAGRARRAVPSRPTGGPRRPVETRRIHRAAWRETRQAKNYAVAPAAAGGELGGSRCASELAEALAAADAGGRAGRPRRAPRAAGLPDARPGAGAARGAAHRAATATPPGTSGTWPRRSPTSRSAPRRSPRRRRTWRPRCCARATGTGW